ncbi:NADH dehydrogenase ubiquinone Fe-S protein 4 [Bradyrhizobium sp. CB3481]|uniref:NADH dehydrogenase ubiquinone Fe-S protein 4 n=1 Tax=Bradyrhizobium sp. CB3481 TaxID=3039158 RepID=UPI0024B14EA7|nr:NADH dehydrogenase ubiquinone Fe-S protein 4 [Bradyrhizobium sp. CB3481]WFU19964.1 ETC complex I subunit [Bradyrhizobium sp. CB3481]
MGWTGDDDPLATVELSFPTLRAAIRYAESQRVPYVVENATEPDSNQRQSVRRGMKHAFSDETLKRLGLGSLPRAMTRPSPARKPGRIGAARKLGVRRWR